MIVRTVAAPKLTDLVAAIMRGGGCDAHEATMVARRLVDSNLVGHDSHGVIRVGKYLEWMRLPDEGHFFGLFKSIRWYTVAEWPAIRADLDGGRPCPLGLIKVESVNPFDVGDNHQILAYGYDLDGTDLTLRLYDPNYPDRDDVTLQLSTASAHVPIPLTYTPAEDVFCFFRTPYSPRQPPAS